ncbi:unnamed protein product [Clonostachys byssicola]|uniref:Uncharacterized protein n=1 Tax=Clonostachys byssicola TaxID=160290 RepID=A0A9N9UWW9_9HYPO|nr:unnamed protein product [Clonostachys byssicola]
MACGNWATSADSWPPSGPPTESSECASGDQQDEFWASGSVVACWRETLQPTIFWTVAKCVRFRSEKLRSEGIKTEEGDKRMAEGGSGFLN